MQQKKRKMTWYLLIPLVIEWCVTFGVQLAAIVLGIDVSKYAVELTMGIAIVLIPVFILMYRMDQKEKHPWWNKLVVSNIKVYLLIVVLGIFTCIATNDFVLLSGVTNDSEVYQSTAELIYTAPIWLQAIGLGVLVPIMEELMYRGLMYRRMREYVSVGTAMFVSAIVFGAGHGNMVQFIFASIIGVFLAYLMEVYRTVKAAMVFHVAVNLTSLICTWTGFLAWVFTDFIRVAVITVLASVGAAACVLYIRNNSEMLQKC